jgi:hypothetical protein
MELLSYFTDMDLQKKLFYTLGTIILILILTLIFGISNYEQPIQDVIEEFVTASENLNLSKLLNITTGKLHSNIVNQRDTISDIKNKIHFQGYLENYQINFLNKTPEMAKVEIIPEITESYSGNSGITYRHNIIIDVIQIENNWKISNIKMVDTEITG